MDPHCFDADPHPDPAQNLDADPDPGGGVGQPKMCIPPGKILGTPLPTQNLTVGIKIINYSLDKRIPPPPRYNIPFNLLMWNLLTIHCDHLVL